MRYTKKYDSSKTLSFFDIFLWQIKKKRLLPKENSNLHVKYEKEKLKIEDDFICWLGHASFLIQLDRKRILLDPVFWDIPFYKRYIDMPYTIDKLGKIDYIFLSHIHYDLFDTKTLKQFKDKPVKFIVPLGVENYLKKIDKHFDIVSLDWYESYANFTLTPAKHWNKRGIFDTNSALWGGVFIKGKKNTIFFSGDSAYEKHFQELSQSFSIDYALLPIGAYKPKQIMKHNHMDPKEALVAFQDLKAKYFIPMHYGTFRLSDEGINEPMQFLLQLPYDPKKTKLLLVGEVFGIMASKNKGSRC